MLQRLALNLPYPLARQPEVLRNLFQRVLAIEADSEPHADYLLFAGRERLQHIRRLRANILLKHRVRQRIHRSILQQIAQSGLAILADREIQRHRIARNSPQLLDFVRRSIQPLADLLVGWSAVQLFFQLAQRPHELVQALIHMNRNPDGAALVRDGARHRLPDPPRCVCRKFIPKPVVELLRRPHEPDIAFLNQVQQVQPAVHVFLGDRDNQAQVCLHQRLPGRMRFRLTVPRRAKPTAHLSELRTRRRFALTKRPP